MWSKVSGTSDLCCCCSLPRRRGSGCRRPLGSLWTHTTGQATQPSCWLPPTKWKSRVRSPPAAKTVLLSAYTSDWFDRHCLSGMACMLVLWWPFMTCCLQDVSLLTLRTVLFLTPRSPPRIASVCVVSERFACWIGGVVRLQSSLSDLFVNRVRSSVRMVCLFTQGWSSKWSWPHSGSRVINKLTVIRIIRIFFS